MDENILDLSFEEIEEGSTSDSDNDNGDLGDLDLEEDLEDFAEVDGQAQAVGAAAVDPVSPA